MVEMKPEVRITEQLDGASNKWILAVEILVGNSIKQSVEFKRSITPEAIAESFMDTGLMLKYGELEEGVEEVGDIFIQASYNVPG
jgi:hypothetical protein